MGLGSDTDDMSLAAIVGAAPHRGVNPKVCGEGSCAVTLMGTPDVQFAAPRLRNGFDLGDPPTDPSQTPAVPPPPPHRSPRAGRPDPTHGGAGDDPPDGPRPRRGPASLTDVYGSATALGNYRTTIPRNRNRRAGALI